MSIPKETLAWLKQAANKYGVGAAIVDLNLLRRVEALEKRLEALEETLSVGLPTPEPPAGPTDEELLSVDDLRAAWNAQADAANSWPASPEEKQ